MRTEGNFLNIEKAKPEYSEWFNEVIKREFPYTEFTAEKIEEKINNPKYLLLVARQHNILTGFCELEFFEGKKEARLNCVFVEEAWRDQRIATMLIRQAVNKCKHRKLERIFLLVKMENEGAKHLYDETGFSFEKMHDKEIEGSQVEVWSQGV